MYCIFVVVVLFCLFAVVVAVGATTAAVWLVDLPVCIFTDQRANFFLLKGS